MRQHLLILVSYCFTNILTTIIIKMQGYTTVVEAGQQRNFFHPYMQTWIMILGEGLCFIVYFFSKSHKNEQQSNKQKADISICLLPLFLDLLSASLIFLGSVYSVMSCQVIVFTAIFSKFILKSTLSRAHIIGSFLTIIGAVLAGIGQSLQQHSNQQFDNMVVGILLVTAAFAIQGLLVTILQRIYDKYEITPLQMVGWQGMVGSVFWSILMVIFSLISCPFEERQCVMDSNYNSHIDHALVFLQQIGSNAYLLVLTLAYILIVARFNYDQSTVILKMNAITLCIIRIFSNSLVWIIGIIITLIGDGDKQLKLQSLDLLVNAVKLLAFIFSTLGLLVYNQIIWKKCLVKNAQSKTESHESYSIVTEQ